MKEFIKINKLGTLQIDKILFESHYPILFTCVNESSDLFLCICCQANKDGKRWLITKTIPQTVIKILKDEITLREAFLQFTDIQYTVFSNSEVTTIKENDLSDWDYENSIYLPEKDEYMEVEDGEFDEEILYYEKLRNDNYKEIKLEKVFSPSIDKFIESELNVKDIFSISVKDDIFTHSEVFTQTFNNVLEIYINKAETYEINYNKKVKMENLYKKTFSSFLEAKSFVQGYIIYQKEDDNSVAAA
jgi:hypothetical protein